MKYMGSKNSIAREILPIILRDRGDRLYIEPFVGGANSIDKVDGPRLGADSNPYVIALLEAIRDKHIPERITKEQYLAIKANPNSFPPALVGYAGICCSYSGKWFGGFAGETKTAIGTIRDYQEEARANIKAQALNLAGCRFLASSYESLEIPENSIVYCDPPYNGTTKYGSGIDHSKFWEWCKDLSLRGIRVFVSEYKAPNGWSCVWNKSIGSSLSANGKIGGRKTSVENLYTWPCG